MARTKALRFWAAWKWVQQVREQRLSYPTSPCTSSRRTAELACCSRRMRGIADPRGPCNGDIGTCSRIRDSDGSANGARRTTWPPQCARTLTHASSPIATFRCAWALAPCFLYCCLQEHLEEPKGACCPPLPYALPKTAGLRGGPVLTALTELRVHVAGYVFWPASPVLLISIVNNCTQCFITCSWLRSAFQKAFWMERLRSRQRLIASRRNWHSYSKKCTHQEVVFLGYVVEEVTQRVLREVSVPVATWLLIFVPVATGLS